MGRKSNETVWTKSVLVPRLRRLGFNRIDYTHGTMEAGRDVVFADSDRFGVTHYYAAQVKTGSLRARSETRELSSILEQLKFAYETPYEDPASGTEHNIRGVYLVVEGEVSVPARQIFANRLGQWLHIIDGRQLETAGTLSMRYSDEERRSRIVSLLFELRFEEMQLPEAIENLEKAVNATATTTVSLLRRPIRKIALERYMEAAYDELHLDDWLFLSFIMDTVDQANYINDKIPFGTYARDEYLKAMEVLLVVMKQLREDLPKAGELLKYVLSQERAQPGDHYERWPDNPMPQSTSKGDIV